MEKNVLWSSCNSCGRQTKQTVLFTKTQKELGEDGSFEYGKTHYQVLECNGCETISFRTEEHDFLHEVIDPETGEIEGYELTINNYPYGIKNYKVLKNSYNLPKKIRDVYDQTMLAFKAKSNLLTGVGCRAIIEAICLEENVKGQNLEQKINNLLKNKLITEKEAERLHTIRFLGNDAVHEMEIPPEGKLYLVIEIIEHLLKNLYLIDNDAKYVLDTIIKNYSDFEHLIYECSKRMKVGDEKSMIEILGKNIRRITNFNELELAFIESLKKGFNDYLKLGEFKSNNNIESESQQYYLLVRETIHDLPF